MMHEIKRPIFIMHMLDTGKAECIIFGVDAPTEADEHKVMGLYIADLIGHVAKANGVTKANVIDWVNRELGMPTTELIRTDVN